MEDAERILADVEPKKCFWVNNGPVIRNLHELERAIEHMSDETFRYHINKEKNDFANWIRDVLIDDKLADNTQKTESKDKILKKIRARIKFLEKIIDEERLKSLNGNS